MGTHDNDRISSYPFLEQYTMRLLCIATLLLHVTAFVPTSLRTLPSIGYDVQQPDRPGTDAVRKLSSRYRVLHPSTMSVVESSQDARTSRGEDNMGIIICDHGSRRKEANDMLFEVAKRYRCYAGSSVVEVAHMEMAEPTIEQAFDRCVEAGAKKIVLHPFFLSPGRHVTSDIPKLMQAAARRHPEVAWVISEPLGLQELMPRVMHAAVTDSVVVGQWKSGGAGFYQLPHVEE